MPFELSWRPGGSLGFLINLFGFFELTMVVVRGREVTCLRTATLPSQHALMSLLSARNSKGTRPHPQLLALLNDAQCARLKGPLLDTEALLLNLTKCFNPLDAKATPGCRLLDSFPDRISFHPCNRSSLNDRNTHLVLRLMPPQVCMDMGKGYNDDDWLRRSSLSQRLMW